MRKSILGALLMGAMVLGSVPSHAGGASAQYVAIPVFRVSNANVPVGLGGYAFTPPAKLTSIDVDDLNGNGVGVTACQENTSDPAAGDLGNLCGDGDDDISVSWCTNGSPRNVAALNFRPNNSLTVFVPTTDPDQPNCATVATSGTIAVGW